MEKSLIKIKSSACTKDCPGGCSLKVHVENGTFTKVEGDKTSPISAGIICSKARKYPKYLDSKRRLLSPMKRTQNNGFEKISWDQAYEMLFDQLKACKDSNTTKSVFRYNGSGDFGIMSTKYAQGFWSQFGTITSVKGCLCNSAGREAVKFTYGDKKQNDRQEIANSNLMLLWGKNPENTDIHTMMGINKALNNGSKLVVIDPRVNKTSKKADLHIRPNLGTDGFLALGFAKLLKEAKVFDYKFIEENCYGFEAYNAYLDSIEIDHIVSKTGVTLENMRAVVAYITESPNYSLLCGYGLQRYENGGQTIRSLAILPALTGSIGKSGGGFYFSDSSTGKFKWPYNAPSPLGTDRLVEVGKMGSYLDKLSDPELKVLWIEKANPLVSNPDSNAFRRGMKHVPFTVVIDLFMTETAKEADLILPAASLFEKDDLATASGSHYVQLRERVINPIGESKSETEIYHELAKRFGSDMSYLPTDFEKIVDAYCELNQLETSFKGLQKEPYLHSTMNRIAYESLEFSTPSGKIEFYSESISKVWDVDPLPVFKELSLNNESKYPLRLSYYHSKDGINSQMMNPDYDQSSLKMNTKDADEREISSGDQVTVTNELGSIRMSVEVSDEALPGTVFAVFEVIKNAGLSLNTITHERLTDLGEGTASNGQFVKVSKVNA